MASTRNVWLPGERVHGFAGGMFGRDSYTCRTVEAVGPDWIVTRSDNGTAEFAARYLDTKDGTEPGVYCDCDGDLA